MRTSHRGDECIVDAYFGKAAASSQAAHSTWGGVLGRVFLEARSWVQVAAGVLKVSFTGVDPAQRDYAPSPN